MMKRIWILLLCMMLLPYLTAAPIIALPKNCCHSMNQSAQKESESCCQKKSKSPKSKHPKKCKYGSCACQTGLNWFTVNTVLEPSIERSYPIFVEKQTALYRGLVADLVYIGIWQPPKIA